MINVDKLRSELKKMQIDKEIDLRTNLTVGKGNGSMSREDYISYTMFISKPFWTEMKRLADAQNTSLAKMVIESFILYQSILLKEFDITKVYDGPITTTPIGETNLSIEQLESDIKQIKENLNKLSNHFGVPAQSSDQ